MPVIRRAFSLYYLRSFVHVDLKACLRMIELCDLPCIFPRKIDRRLSAIQFS